MTGDSMPCHMIDVDFTPCGLPKFTIIIKFKSTSSQSSSSQFHIIITIIYNYYWLSKYLILKLKPGS